MILFEYNDKTKEYNYTTTRGISLKVSHMRSIEIKQGEQISIGGECPHIFLPYRRAYSVDYQDAKAAVTDIEQQILSHYALDGPEYQQAIGEIEKLMESKSQTK